MHNSTQFLIENNGQTPASNVRTRTSFIAFSPPVLHIPATFSFKGFTDNDGIYSSGYIAKDKNKIVVGMIPDEDVHMFKDATDIKATIIVYGHVDYCDIFSIPRRTDFCYIYIPGGGKLPLCESHNGEGTPEHQC